MKDPRGPDTTDFKGHHAKDTKCPIKMALNVLVLRMSKVQI